MIGKGDPFASPLAPTVAPVRRGGGLFWSATGRDPRPDPVPRLRSLPTVDRLIDQPISLDAVLGFLVATPFFGELDAFERAEVVRIMEVQRLTDGEEVFHEGDAGNSWYVIFEGQVAVARAGPSGTERQIAALDAGACFGEMAILDGAPRSATVRAVGAVTIFRFRRLRFDELLRDASLGAYKLVAAMAREQSKRLRLLSDQVLEMIETAPNREVVSDDVGGMVQRNQISE
jgi:CRP/FNR family transcriptional regulator, cyclic AMP receptor protein